VVSDEWNIESPGDDMIIRRKVLAPPEGLTPQIYLCIKEGV
jgi:hypothetical protein